MLTAVMLLADLPDVLIADYLKSETADCPDTALVDRAKSISGR
jgi:hypothetical protein